MTWTTADIQDLSGQSIIITGANSGIGLEAAIVLAQKGAAVTLAVRDAVRGQSAADQIRASYPDSQVEVARLDLADLASVRQFASE
ncbi:MAG: SDR family NAD(P)-dependent oxidoreductase, partial [Actinomycetota bacterium]|nr:SDR family NAD(P)-dependent oxidoreductase [Actinomycetota bacterium]